MESVSETRVVLPAAAEAAALLRGAVEKFAFARAVSRLYEMQAPLFLAARPRHE
jgi:predicted ATPase